MLKYLFTRYIKRIVCLVKGCELRWYSSAYMPDDYHSPCYCKRCEACDDVYQIESTDYEIIYKR